MSIEDTKGREHDAGAEKSTVRRCWFVRDLEVVLIVELGGEDE